MNILLTKSHIAASAILLTVSLAAFAGERSSRSSSDDEAFPTVINPDVPRSMEFCGDRVDLDRIDMFERFDRELTSMVYGHGNTLLTIKRANKYFPIMAPILRDNGVPIDLLYVACIESYLNQRAYSSAKAAGMWQFVPATAKEYGLEVNDEIDERYNIEKSTEAACRYLKRAYQRYGNWESAMASYNAGNGRISRELDSQNSDSSFDLYLNDETSRYVFRVMAMKAIMENPRTFGYKLKAEQLYQPAEYDIIEVSGPVADWPTWADEHKISYARLREDNPWIRAKSLTNKAGKTYQVKVAKESSLKRSTTKTKVFNSSWIVK